MKINMCSNLSENRLMLDEDRNELQNPRVVKELVRLAAASRVGWTFFSQFWDILELKLRSATAASENTSQTKRGNVWGRRSLQEINFSSRPSAVTPTDRRARDAEVLATLAIPTSKWSVPMPEMPDKWPMECAKLKATSKPHCYSYFLHPCVLACFAQQSAIYIQ